MRPNRPMRAKLLTWCIWRALYGERAMTWLAHPLTC